MEKKCIYVEGSVIPVTTEHAEERVAKGEWIECFSTHVLPPKYKPDEYRVFHRK